jgi:hypothetical protein
MMRPIWEHYVDSVARPHFTARDNNAHDPALTDEFTRGRTLQHRLHQALLKSIELFARISQTGDSNDRRRSDVQQSVSWQRKDVEAAGRDVLTELAGAHVETLGPQLIEKLRVNQVYLPEVRLTRIRLEARSVPHRFPTVRVAANPEAGDQRDECPCTFGEAMGWAGVYGEDCRYVSILRHWCPNPLPVTAIQPQAGRPLHPRIGSISALGYLVCLGNGAAVRIHVACSPTD